MKGYGARKGNTHTRKHGLGSDPETPFPGLVGYIIVPTPLRRALVSGSEGSVITFVGLRGVEEKRGTSLKVHMGHEGRAPGTLSVGGR